MSSGEETGRFVGVGRAYLGIVGLSLQVNACGAWLSATEESVWCGEDAVCRGDAGCVGCANLSWRRSVVQPTAIDEQKSRPGTQVTDTRMWS